LPASPFSSSPRCHGWRSTGRNQVLPGLRALLPLSLRDPWGCPREPLRSSFCSALQRWSFLVPIDRSNRAQTVPPRLTQSPKPASASASKQSGLPLQARSLGFRPGCSTTSSRVAGPTEQAACATSRRSSHDAPAAPPRRACSGSGLPPHLGDSTPWVGIPSARAPLGRPTARLTCVVSRGSSFRVNTSASVVPSTSSG
jgi:hypothetical protein